MNELLNDTKSVLLFLMGAIMAIFGWLGKRAINRLDECVTRKELAQTLSQMREDRLQMHRENREELRYIRERVDGIADRQ